MINFGANSPTMHSLRVNVRRVFAIIGGSKVTCRSFAFNISLKHVMASRAFVSTVVLSLTACLLAHSRAAYESAGCSDQGCGIPCYMRPAADNCHYKPHSPCSNEGYDLDLENVILALNSSLHRLENKLVQKRVSKSRNHSSGSTPFHHVHTHWNICIS